MIHAIIEDMKQIDRQIDRYIDRQMDRQIDDIQKDRQIDRKIGRQIGRQKDRQIYFQIDIQIGRQKDRQIYFQIDHLKSEKLFLTIGMDACEYCLRIYLTQDFDFLDPWNRIQGAKYQPKTAKKKFNLKTQI